MERNFYYISLREGSREFTIGVDNTEAAYEAWRRACDFAEAAGISCCDLWWGETGEVVASLRDDEDDPEDFSEGDLEIGFDPYEGGYTWDC